MKKICFTFFFKGILTKLLEPKKIKKYSQADYKDKSCLEESQGMNEIRRV